LHSRATPTPPAGSAQAAHIAARRKRQGGQPPSQPASPPSEPRPKTHVFGAAGSARPCCRAAAPQREPPEPDVTRPAYTSSFSRRGRWPPRRRGAVQYAPLRARRDGGAVAPITPTREACSAVVAVAVGRLLVDVGWSRAVVCERCWELLFLVASRECDGPWATLWWDLP